MGRRGGRCGEFGTKDVAYIVNRELYSVPRLDWVMACRLVIAHMIEFTHSPCLAFASRLNLPLRQLITRPTVEALHERRIQKILDTGTELEWAEIPNTIRHKSLRY